MSAEVRGLLEPFLLAALACGSALAQGDPERDIKAKEPERRLDAVEGVKALGGERAEKLLIGALLDKDWEVVERAAAALREVGTKAAVPQLVKVAIDAPAARMRRAAAETLARIDPVKAAEDLARLTAGKSATRAWEALAIVAPLASGAGAETLAKNLVKSQRSKDAAEKSAAAGALAGVARAEQLASLEAYLSGDDVGHAASALRAVSSVPDAAFLAPIAKKLSQPGLDDVLERRLIGTVCAIAGAPGAEGADGARAALDGLCASADAGVAARGMRLAAALGRIQADGAKPLEAAATSAIESGCRHPDPRVRAAALHAGGGLGHEGTLKEARRLAAGDPDGHARLIALRQLVERVGVADQEVFGLVSARLAQDADGLVREEAAVALGRLPSEESARALEGALHDREWTVAACAAVSLGKTFRKSGLQPLLELARDPDWKRRGAAVVGLCHLTQPEGVPAILAAIADAEPAVARTAWLYAKGLTHQDLPQQAPAWQAWWRENGAKVRLLSPEEARQRRGKYGYAQSATEVFRDLDVVVLDSRGDHIQKILDHERIAYRTTTAAHHRDDALHANAVYVSNCTGEVEEEDIQRIAWFLRTGGYMFSSCWSLHETIEKTCPGIVRKFETGGQVLDTVLAEPCAEASPYLKGVFEGGVQPHYNLEGAHLIEVLDRERCEVLVDSPECATRWGIGNLAVWFRVGHGLVLDSVNHFDNQGLTNASWLKETEERQAYALDHMGLSWADWRALQDEKWWGSNSKAAERVFDLTALHLVTNFVRGKRLEEM